MMQISHCKGVTLCLIGPNRFQDELFVSALKENHDCRCLFVVAADLSDIPAEVWNKTEQKNLFYLDCFGLGLHDVETLLSSVCLKILSGNLLALFNLPEYSGFEKTALAYGVRGFFSPDSTPIDFCRGTRAMLNGEVWLPRKAISEILFGCLSSTPQYLPPGKNPANLSAREKEVLTILSTGVSNKDIAADLYISVHTVRTHLYHIFKKIEVTNRSQAILWAEKTL